MGRSPLDAVRRPEHTGERRCWPCTVVNVVLVVFATVVVDRRWRRLAALPVLAAGLALVHLRGYVLPGTPRFAPRLVAALPLPYDPFDHEAPGRDPPRAAREATAPDRDAPASVDGPDALGDAVDEADGEELLGTLVEAGVVSVEGEQVVPAPEFADAWESTMADLAALDTDALGAAAEEVAHAAGVEVFRHQGDEWIVVSDGSDGFEGEMWLSRPVAIAEVGAVRALDGWVPDRATRLAAAGTLRMFLDECPDCEVPLEASTTASCCGGYTDPESEPDDVLFCPDCESRLYTFED